MAGALVLAATAACSKAKEREADWKADPGAESATVPAMSDSLSAERMDTMSSGGTAEVGQPADAPAKPQTKPDPAATVPHPAPDSTAARSTLDTLSRVPTDPATPADSASWVEAEKRDTTIETIDGTPDSAAVKLNLSLGDSATEPAPQALAAEPSPGEPSPTADAMTAPSADTGAVTADTLSPNPAADQAAATEPTPASATVDLSGATSLADSGSEWNGAATGADSSVTAAIQPAEEREDVAAPTDPSPVDTTEPAAPATGYAEMARDTAITPESDTLPGAELQGNRLDQDGDGVVADVTAEPDAAATTAGGDIMTGADAVTAMTRQDQQCVVAPPESDLAADLQWDMTRTPANVNPCGLGTMVISSLVTGDDEVNAAGDNSDDAAKLEAEDDSGY